MEKVLIWIKLRYNNPPVLITENGKLSLPGVEPSVGLLLSFFFDNIRVIYSEYFLVFNISRIWVSVSIFVSDIMQGLDTIQEPLCLGKIALLSVLFRMGLAQMTTWVYKDSSSWSAH